MAHPWTLDRGNVLDLRSTFWCSSLLYGVKPFAVQYGGVGESKLLAKMEGNRRDDGGDGGGAQTQVPIPDPNPSSPQTRGFKAKSCKGTAYYSSARKSKSKNPICIGFPRKFQQVPFSIEREIVERDVGSPTYFNYVYAGYSVYLDSSADSQDEPVKFPICYGFKWMLYKIPSFSAAGHVATPVQKNEEREPQPQPRYKPPNTRKEE